MVKEVFAKIREINQKRKMSIIVVEHNIKSLLEIANRAYVIDKGKVIKEGKSELFLGDDVLEKVLTGRG